MDQRSLDTLARTMAQTVGRRALLAALGVGAAGVAASFRARTGVGAPAAQTCRANGAACSIYVPCCAGLVCARSSYNPNSGFCREITTAVAAATLPAATATATATPPPPTPTPSPSPSPSPTPEPPLRRKIDLEARCERDTGADRIIVENNDDVPLVIETIRVAGRRDFNVDRTIPGGRAGIFEFGPGAGADRVSPRRLVVEGGRSRVVTFYTPDRTAFRVNCRDDD